MRTEACSNCKFCKLYQRGFENSWFVCRRYPPQVIQDFARSKAEDIHEGAYPATRQDGWCGEHRPK